ncbi:SDR family NAD(P)-dependent oxidoreductase [Methylobacterium oryzihabitans]|uniref:SDR family NAD(P)-dependent oxidoreductase n=1 Tax=Methylobacterium oryzihabitans TaxID=2499852 RepID=A0A3S2VMR6_9HYPH|nr:SDR family NAD(P)-dependent oxidoreductase [Methylobacterium oryzihabitans]RVU16313.1 SDR family NAD(P)-dependent oxidoreductase [Methylobacterium oryzihabitans]
MTSAVVIGASGGIGRALAAALVARGDHAPVFALSRSGAPGPDGTEAGRIDVTDEASVADAAGLVARAGPVGLVVVASGLLHRDGIAPEKALRALDPAAMAELFAVNAIGPALVAKHLVPLLPRSGRAVFAALSARVGSIGDNRLGGWYSYRASKAALNQILRTLAIEVARTRPEAIVAGLHPGTVGTGLSRPFRPDADAPGIFRPEESADHLLRVLDGLAPGDSGGVFAWDGQRIPA